VEDWIFELIEQGGYIGIFLLMLLETVFPPIPSEVIMPVAGLSAASGTPTLGGVIVAGTAGAMAGNVVWYLLARGIGIDRFRSLIEKYGRWLTIAWPDVERARATFGRFGDVIVCTGRMVPTIRSVVSIPAGLLRMRLPGFLVWSTIGTAVWSSGLAVAGWWLGRQFGDIETVIGSLSTAVVIAIVALYLWRQVTWHRRRPAA
jgi:membrane protein DedA with SNARE-associated domain